MSGITGKGFRNVGTIHLCVLVLTLQTGLRQLEAMTRNWQLRFNEEKCKVMHLGQYNQHNDYAITNGGKDTTLGEITNENDLRVQIDRKLKFDQQVEMVANKASPIEEQEET